MRVSCLLLSLALVGCSNAPGPPGELPGEDAAFGEPDLALAPIGCNPPCGGLTPFCNAAKRCVGCLDDPSCPPGSFCKVSGPDAATCVPGCKDDRRCGGGKCCTMRCVDVGNDSSNCGACGNKCSGHHTQAICVAGKCQMGKCDSGWGDCNKDPKDGCEANLHVDADHCTGCGMKCNMPNAVNACADGCYAAACKWGFDDCNRDPADGCETAVLADGANCGACGKSCAKLPNAAAGCQNGGCVLGRCNPGYFDCDRDPKTGCESSLVGDPKNCGACGKVCPMNLPFCSNGTCAVGPTCMRIGWKLGQANWDCPMGYRMPNMNEYAAVQPCVEQGDLAKMGDMHDIATMVGGCNCKWNNNWCGQPSIETIRQGRMCGDFDQLHICIK